MWSSSTLLLQLFVTFLASAATLPPSLQYSSSAGILSNRSHGYIKCLPRPNATHHIYDSPLELAMTFGDRPFASWQLTVFLQYALISIQKNAAQHPHEYIPGGYYSYHDPPVLGSVSVIPSLFRDFTWSDLYLVLHGLAEYVINAPHAYEMCVEINFRKGGLAGVMFVNWWTPLNGTGLHDRDPIKYRLVRSDI